MAGLAPERLALADGRTHPSMRGRVTVSCVCRASAAHGTSVRRSIPRCTAPACVARSRAARHQRASLDPRCTAPACVARSALHGTSVRRSIRAARHQSTRAARHQSASLDPALHGTSAWRQSPTRPADAAPAFSSRSVAEERRAPGQAGPEGHQADQVAGLDLAERDRLVHADRDRGGRGIAVLLDVIVHLLGW
jgi:hypothetical protein